MKVRAMVWVVLWTVALWTAAWAVPASAAPAEADRERAAELFRNGDTLYNEGNYEAAILAFQEALELSGEAVLHFNIANCLEILGRLDEAQKELNLYRAVAPEEEKGTLDRRLSAMRERMSARKKLVTPEPVPVPVPVPVPTPVPVLPEPLEVRPVTWALVGSGGAIGVASITGLALSYRGIARHQAAGQRSAVSLDRAVNAVSWLGLGAGAGLAITGIVVVGPGQLGVDTEGVTISGQF